MKVDSATVLVVDDNKMTRDVLCRRLQQQGHQIVKAENGRRALELMRQQTLDLVLLDIMMPEMDGYQVLEHIKADEKLRHVPVIVISAIEELDSAVRCIELGAEDYMTKPFKRVLLQARIGASLEKKRLRDQEQNYLQELKAINRIDRELNTSLNVKQAMNITLEWAIRRSNSQAGLIGWVSDNSLQVMASQGYAAELPTKQNGHLLLNASSLRQAINCGEPKRLYDTPKLESLLTNTASQLIIPICHECAVVGVLWLESAQSHAYPDEVLSFLNRLCDHAAVALINAKLYQELQIANQAKSDFVYFVAHELKNPMASIRGYTDLLQKGIVSAESQDQALSTICANVKRMDKLVCDLSDIAKIEEGQLRLDPQATDLSKAIDEAVYSMRQQIEDKAQTLNVNIPPDVPPVWADHARLVQVLVNLVSNAHKYTPEGGQIRLWAEQPDNGDAVVQITVQDSGIGICAKDQAKIFQKFFRSSDEPACKAPGTGLGLNITKNLVELQGGRIWFESQFRRGTTFCFTVPIAAD